jgi:glycosyltransferase involved in cell wall biosynthesis
MKKTIVHIIDSLCIGGRENIIIDICNNLNKDKYSVFIITLCNDDNIGASKLEKSVILLPLPFPLKSIDRANTFMSFFLVKNKLTKLIKEINPDIIHTHSYFHRLLIIAFSIRSSIGKAAFFHTVHTSGMYFSSTDFINRVKLATEKFALSLYNPSLIAISEIVQENNKFFFKKCSKQSKYIPNGIDLNRYDLSNYNRSRRAFNFDEEDILIVYIARLCAGKNHITLLEATKELVKKHGNLKLLLAGDGELRSELECFVKNNGLEKNVIFFGSINNVPELLAVSDIGIFPSEFEGFGVALIEMMAMQLPVVAADNQMFKKMITHGENGFLYPMFDVCILVNYIERLIKNESLRIEIGKKAKQYSKQFSIEKMILNHEAYYES